MEVLEHESDLVQAEIGQLIAPSLQMSAPSTETLPESGLRMPESTLSNVVLPLPEGPTMYSISPK